MLMYYNQCIIAVGTATLVLVDLGQLLYRLLYCILYISGVFVTDLVPTSYLIL